MTSSVSQLTFNHRLYLVTRITLCLVHFDLETWSFDPETFYKRTPIAV